MLVHVVSWVLRMPLRPIRTIMSMCWRDFNKRRRRLQYLIREPYYAFVTFVVLTALAASWFVVLTFTWSEWQEMAMTNRNRQLMSLLGTFPKQNGLNLTAYELNVGLSNTIPLDRDIPDTRPQGCTDMVYSLDRLPTASVIIPFYNEAWSMLLRCLHSVIDRSPPNLIKEVILVDDNSDYHYLKDTLRDYASVLSSKIRIIRNKEREGLIRARALAAQQAVGDVIVFLDAHVECNHGWLPPLLQVIKEKKQTIAVPHIDNIMPNTIKYKQWRGYGYGSFQWNMDYVWKLVPSSVLKKRRPSDNYFTPTTIGCAMVIDRDYFFSLGGFDDDMYIWGGENLEISFRTWMCGGSLVIVPCSRVGHVFRRWLPYSFPQKYGGRYIKFKNYQRVADVWMGEYSLYYYASIQGEVYYTKEDMSSLKKRKQIISDLHCKSFKWYLDNIVQDMVIPSTQALLYGQLKVLGGNACLSGNRQASGYALPLTYCGMQSLDQVFMYMQDSTIVHQDSCLTAKSQSDVTLMPCATGSSRQKWLREIYATKDPIFAVNPEAKGTFYQYSTMIKGTKSCLTHMSISKTEILGVMPCSHTLEMAVYQSWSFTLTLDFTFARKVYDRRRNIL